MALSFKTTRSALIISKFHNSKQDWMEVARNDEILP